MCTLFSIFFRATEQAQTYLKIKILKLKYYLIEHIFRCSNAPVLCLWYNSGLVFLCSNALVFYASLLQCSDAMVCWWSDATVSWCTPLSWSSSGRSCVVRGGELRHVALVKWWSGAHLHSCTNVGLQAGVAWWCQPGEWRWAQAPGCVAVCCSAVWWAQAPDCGKEGA